MAKKRLTEYLAEVLTKSQTEEGRRELLEERDRVEAEAKRRAAGGPTATPSPLGPPVGRHTFPVR